MNERRRETFTTLRSGVCSPHSVNEAGSKSNQLGKASLKLWCGAHGCENEACLGPGPAQHKGS